MLGSMNSDHSTTAGTPTAAAPCIRPPSVVTSARHAESTASACRKVGVSTNSTSGSRFVLAGPHCKSRRPRTYCGAQATNCVQLCHGHALLEWPVALTLGSTSTAPRYGSANASSSGVKNSSAGLGLYGFHVHRPALLAAM